MAANVSVLLDEAAKLEAQLISLEAQIAAASAPPPNALELTKTLPPGAIPATTDISIALEFNPAARRIELVVAPTLPDLSLRAVAVYALDAGVFGAERESALAVATSAPPSDTSPGSSATASAAGSSSIAALRVPLAPGDNVATEVRVQAIVCAHRTAVHGALLEKIYRLPRFVMFQPLPPRATPVPLPRAGAAFVLRDRAQRIGMWIARSFAVSDTASLVPSPAGATAGPAMDVRFLNLRSGGMLRITVESEAGGLVAIACEDMHLAGDIISDMATALALSDVESSAEFPDEFDAFKATLGRLDELTAVRSRLTGDSAALTATVKALVVTAEDARLLVDMGAARAAYGELRRVQGEMMAEYVKRSANHNALMETLKEVNQMIQKAANLRVGEPKARVIAACRAALKVNNPLAMLAVMTTGKAADK